MEDFGFDIQYRDPPIEHHSFYLPNEQMIVFSEDDVIDNIVKRPNVRHNMFLA